MNQTPLHAAAAGGSYSVVKLLLDAGVNIDTMDTNEVSYPGFIWGGGEFKGGLARIESHHPLEIVNTA